MPAFQFDSTGIDPHYGGGQPQLPVGKHPVVIVGSELKPTRNNDGGFMALTLEAIDGPAKGVQHIDRLNLHNKNPETVRIANQQLSAFCAVTGVFRFNATEELHGKPFVVDIVPDPDERNPNRTKIGKLMDMNGNPPGQAGAGAPAGQAGGFGGATGGAPANTGGGFAPGAGAPADASQGGGAPAGGGTWGGAGGGQQGGGAAPAGGAGGWSQGGGNGGAPAGGGAPGWGQR